MQASDNTFRSHSRARKQLYLFDIFPSDHDSVATVYARHAACVRASMMSPLRACLLLPLLSACGSSLSYEVASTPKAPGADASLSADPHAAQHLTNLELSVKELAPPGRVADGAQHYVAWFRKNSDTQWSRIGALDYETDARKGKLTGSVPELAFDFEVSAEDSRAPVSPSANIVLAQRVAE